MRKLFCRNDGKRCIRVNVELYPCADDLVFAAMKAHDVTDKWPTTQRQVLAEYRLRVLSEGLPNAIDENDLYVMDAVYVDLDTLDTNRQELIEARRAKATELIRELFPQLFPPKGPEA